MPHPHAGTGGFVDPSLDLARNRIPMRESHQGVRAKGRRGHWETGDVRTETHLEPGFAQDGIPARNLIRDWALIMGCMVVLPGTPASPGFSSRDFLRR